jgi:hypothetical protein
MLNGSFLPAADFGSSLTRLAARSGQVATRHERSLVMHAIYRADPDSQGQFSGILHG